MRALVVVAVLATSLSGGCVTRTGTPVAFAPSTYRDDARAPDAGGVGETFKRGERVRGESCEKALALLEVNGVPFGIRLDDSAVPRDTDVAMDAAMAACKGCAFLANVTVQSVHSASCLGLLVEECTIVKGTAMFAVPTVA